MSILQEVLIEEYDRCLRRKKLYKEKLCLYTKGSFDYKRYKKRIHLINADMWAIRRALGFSLYRGLKAFRIHNKNRYNE